MRITTRFDIGDNAFIGFVQVVICGIKAKVGLKLWKFNKSEVGILYRVEDKDGNSSWVDEKFLENSKRIKAKKSKEKNRK